MLLPLLACEASPPAEEAPAPAPTMRVTPEEVTLSAPVGGSDVVQVTITNLDEVALEISDLQLVEWRDLEVLSIGTISAVLVPSDGSAAFEVTFTPNAAGEVENTLALSSSDATDPERLIPIHAVADGPLLSVDTSAETTWVGCAARNAVTLANDGNTDLVVSSVAFEAESDDLVFDVDEATNGALPWTLAPGEQRRTYVTHTPLDHGWDRGTLTVTSNDGLRPEASERYGVRGLEYGETVDSFTVSTQDAVDVLFVVDNSVGAMPWQPRTVASAGAFIDALAGQDYRIGVLTTDSPAFNADVVDIDTPDPTAALERALSVGAAGSSTTMPLEMAYQSTLSGADGADMMREGVQLAIVFVTYSTDSSPSNWADYMSHFESVVASPDLFVAHAISGDYPSGCESADADAGIWAVTEGSGGLYLSVCEEDHAEHMAAIAAFAGAAGERFALTEVAVPETVTVLVDGVPASTEWWFDAEDNAVEFARGLGAGSVVEVGYTVVGECG